MGLLQLLHEVRAFLRAGYPEAAPANGYAPLVALLPRRLSSDEVSAAAIELAAVGQRPIDDTSVRVAITRLTNEMPLTAGR